MFNDPQAVLALIDPGERVLDVGGAAEVFPRADVVVDLAPYASRKPGRLSAAMPERFGPGDWHVGDICAPEVWRAFRDKEFDFVVCSHTLEDVRDPIFVCAQLVRVAKAGYIEVPSRFRECAKWRYGELGMGFEHHRWIVDVEDGTVAFSAKQDWMGQFDFLGEDRRHYLDAGPPHFTAVHWTGSFDYVERMSKGIPVDCEGIFDFYDHYDYGRRDPLHVVRDVPHRGRTLLEGHEYRLGIETRRTTAEILEAHERRLRAASLDRRLRWKVKSLLREARYVMSAPGRTVGRWVGR